MKGRVERQNEALGARSQDRSEMEGKRMIWRNPLLWTLQGWLAMFYVGAGYAKLTEPTSLLIHMLVWPAMVSPKTVTVVGLAEIGVALGMVMPALSWRRFHGVLVGSAILIFIMATVMASVHLLLGSPGFVAINAGLMIAALLVLQGRRRTPP